MRFNADYDYQDLLAEFLPADVVAAVRGALVPQRDDGGAAGEGERGRGDAEGDPRAGGPVERGAEGGAGGREVRGHAAARGGGSGA